MTALAGRGAECRVLDELLASVRAGGSGVRVLLGEAGIGKSSLLHYVRCSASDLRVLGATGIESDVELPFAGLQQACAPVVDLRNTLPTPQRNALAVAFGLSDGATTPDRFLVGLAVAGLLAAAAAERPAVLIVDDIQWLDTVSAHTLFFVARRLPERVGLVLALRTPIDGIAGLPAMAVAGLDDEDARTLLETAFPGRLDPAVRDRIIAEARGNPLALLAITKDLSAVELAGGYQRPDKRPVIAEIEDRYQSTLGSLSTAARRLLVLAASEPVGDPLLLQRAMQHLGLPSDAATAAQDAGLITIDTRVQFQHPLARSVVYRSAPLEERRAVHAALAACTDPEVDPDRRAWHRALAAGPVDAQVADELEASARRARLRGGTAAAAAFLTRAVELTPDPARRGTRALAAAEAHREVASFDAAQQLLAAAELCPLTALQRARLAQLRTRLSFVSARARGDAQALADAVDGFTSVAAQLEVLDTALATEAYLEAMSAAMYLGRHGDDKAVQIATAARRAFIDTPATRPLDDVTHALADRLALGADVAMPGVMRAVETLKRAGRDAVGGQTNRWFWLGFPIVHESLIHEAWDDQGWHDIAANAMHLATESGALALLPSALMARAGAAVEGGDLDAAQASVAEANETAIATGYTPLKYHRLLLSAWRGDDAEATRLINSALKAGMSRGEGRIAGLAHFSSAILHNGHGRYRQARDAALHAAEYEDLGFFGEMLLELIEAAVRADDPDSAAEAMHRLQSRTLACGSPRALGSLARSRALLANGAAAEALFVEALDQFGRTRQAMQTARTHLLYGEWLRRHRSPTQAREQLRTAFVALQQMGATAFAERARRELQAAGAKTRKQPAAPGDALTAQEHQIARLAGHGLTNQEIAGQLFISAHTVEYHLRKVFAKLGIRSRRELRTIFTE
ncbi:LuxR C-terminal-related transcriptional regulator [Mycobacterium sp. MBM]|nr:LuxR C-terminal-related transcriptional regulator [Mycobacterium sp. MBM]